LRQTYPSIAEVREEKRQRER